MLAMGLKLTLLLSALLFSTGCMSTQERQAIREAEHDLKCREIGAQPGSDAYVNCRLQMLQMTAAQDQADTMRRSQAAAAVGAGLSAMGRSYSNAAAAYRPPINCTTRQGMGSYSTTTCY